jgi:hypothetical protein
MGVQVNEGKKIVHSIKEKESLTVLDRFRLFIDGLNIQPTWKDAFLKLVDLFEKQDREQSRKIISWKPNRTKGKDKEIER